MKALSRFMDDFRPRLRIFGGDCWDFRAWRTKAGPKEQHDDTEVDFNAGLKFLSEFKPTHFILGNHDTRIWDRSEDALDGRVRNYAQSLIDRAKRALPARCEVLPYHKRKGVLTVGRLRFIHGFPTHTGVTAARRVAQEYGSCLFGHGHAIDSATIPGLERRTAQMVGCLCHLDMGYNHSTVSSLRYANGFAYGHIDTDSGDFQVFQAEAMNGKMVVAKGVQVLAA